MQGYLASYAASVAALLVCDFAWLSTVGTKVYRPRLGALLLDQPVILAAAAFYLLYAVGILIFVVTPALRAEAWTRALALGVLFGIFAYATYDLTNLATLRGWSGLVTLLDIAWGGCITGLAGLAGYLVAQRMAA